MASVIHVNQQRIARNQKLAKRPQDRFPPIIVINDDRTRRYGNRVAILGPDNQPVAVLVYAPDNPMPCGARLWIETTAPVQVID